MYNSREVSTSSPCIGSLCPSSRSLKSTLEDVDDPHARRPSDDRRERFEVRIVLVRREQNELTNAGRFPRVDEVVEHAVKRLFPERRVPGDIRAR